ncbi:MULTISPECIES: copper resistance protein B [Methylocaldum]|uniref:copper resistance protein B n=1 Tax=unclassified Methylocaldum TaxID=2622260 RepID=UPI001B533042|nr:copper resistance protein B [Methylocaldum sp. 14B]MBP1151392.1 copper resistance protein B [Methylocaldum sp. RMAD-M]
MIPSLEHHRVRRSVPVCAAAILMMFGSGRATAQMDDAIYNYLRFERFEYEGNGDIHLFKWDIEGWTGSDYNKLWVKSEGDYVFEQDIFGRADLQLLYSRNIATFWDAQIGVRRAFEPERTFDGVIGIQGLAPYFFETEAAMFISENGNVLGRFKLAYELLLTQRLIAQPRIEINVSADDIENRGVKAGITEFEAGLRLRYEIVREFAPYIGFDYVEEQSLREHKHSVRAVAGIRAWF